MALPTVDLTDGSYRVAVAEDEIVVPGEYTAIPTDAVYAPWEDAIKSLFRAATDVTADESRVRVRVESSERALVEHGVADDEDEAVARLAVLDHEDVVASDGPDVWTVPAPDADSGARALAFAAVTELAAETLRSALDSIEMRGEELVASEDRDSALQLRRAIEGIEATIRGLDEYHDEIRASIELEVWDDDATTDRIGELTTVLASASRLDRSAEKGTSDEVLEHYEATIDAFGDIALAEESMEDWAHEQFIAELNALADVSEEPLDAEATDRSPADGSEQLSDGSSEGEGEK